MIFIPPINLCKNLTLSVLFTLKCAILHTVKKKKVIKIRIVYMNMFLLAVGQTKFLVTHFPTTKVRIIVIHC